LNSKEQEFLTLLHKHKGILHKVSRIYMDTPEDREDLIQEIILQLWKCFENFKEQSQFSTWMYRVAINTAIIFFKKENKRPDNQTINENIDIADTEPDFAKNSQLEHFYKAVQELNQIEKALIFYFMEGKSHKETSENLGISEINTRVKLNRTKEKLTSIIKRQGYEF
jgi:RNA polymerase sigma factor (sigma-70 family)